MDSAGTGYPYSIYEMEVRDAGTIITDLKTASAETVEESLPNSLKSDRNLFRRETIRFEGNLECYPC